MSPVITVNTAATSSMRASTLGDSAIGRLFGTRRARSGSAATAMQTPRAPPMPANTRLSVIKWRTRRSRPAPIAVRTAISRRRSIARASRRFARLAQAISSTHARGAGERPEQQTRAGRDVVAQRVRGGAGSCDLGRIPLRGASRQHRPSRSHIFDRQAFAQPADRIQPVVVPILVVALARTSSSSRARRRWPGRGSRAA